MRANLLLFALVLATTVTAATVVGAEVYSLIAALGAHLIY